MLARFLFSLVKNECRTLEIHDAWTKCNVVKKALKGGIEREQNGTFGISTAVELPLPPP